MRTSRWATLAFVVVLGLAAFGLAGCSADSETDGGEGTSDAGGAEAVITEEDLAFSPEFLEVNLGDTVTFTNNDTVDHQVLIAGVTLDRQAPGESVTWTATEAGSIDYICTLHPTMMGRIDVK